MEKYRKPLPGRNLSAGDLERGDKELTAHPAAHSYILHSQQILDGTPQSQDPILGTGATEARESSGVRPCNKRGVWGSLLAVASVSHITNSPQI